MCRRPAPPPPPPPPPPQKKKSSDLLHPQERNSLMATKSYSKDL